MQKTLFINGLLIGLIVISCGSKKKDNSKGVKSSSDLLSEKYHSINSWDSLKYTYQFQECFVESEIPLVFSGKIYDISKSDSLYYVRVLSEKEDAERYFIAIVSVTKEQLKNLNSNHGIFVMKVSKVIASNPSIKSGVRDVEVERGPTGISHEEEYFTFLSDEKENMLTTFQGTLIEMKME